MRSPRFRLYLGEYERERERWGEEGIREASTREPRLQSKPDKTGNEDMRGCRIEISNDEAVNELV